VKYGMFEKSLYTSFGENSSIHVAHMGEMRSAYNNVVGKPKCRRLLERPTHNGKIILEWLFRSLKVWSGCT
jgi:hypothetical protein